TKKPPVVVYFRTYEKKDDVLQLVPDLDVTVTGVMPLRRSRYVSSWDRLKSWLRGWMWRNS
ncbi:MAG: hypothetical protein ACRESX_02705, partial [Gammaproteobacteria bacterium]